MLRLFDDFRPVVATEVAFLNRGKGIDVPDVQSAIEKVYMEINRTNPTLEVMSVKDFGAKGDGVTDDREAIQLAIDTASNNGGGIVYFPPGTYFVTSRRGESGGPTTCLDLKPNVILKGSGMLATTILLQPNAPNWTRIIGISNAENVAIMDLGLNGQWDTLESGGNEHMAGVFVGANARNVIFERVRVYNTRGDNIQLWGSEDQGCHDIVINQCVLDTTGRNNLTIEHACNVFVKHTIMRNAASSCVDMEPVRSLPPAGVSEDGFWGPVYVDNCLLENCISNAYEVTGNSFHFFTNSTVRNFGGNGVHVRNCQGGIIAGNTFTGAIVDPDRTSPIIYIVGPNKNLTVESNVIDLSNNRYRDGIRVVASLGIPVNIHVHDNIIIGPGPDGEETSGNGIRNQGGINCSFERNYVKGFRFGMLVDINHSNDMQLCLIANNNFLDCAVGVYYTTSVPTENRLIDLVVKGNIFKAVQWDSGTGLRFFYANSTSVRPFWIIETVILNEDIPLIYITGAGTNLTHWIEDVKENGAKVFRVLPGIEPEGLISAPIGSVAYNPANGAIWVKARGTGNTGWIEGFQIVKSTDSNKQFVLSVNDDGNIVATEI